ncbi:hypothetical protein ABT160_38325 [Streptomyces sp. NPDC001941]|uniref:hypothetical protein n=1 Tax=Streptomyces sp. NPDC001941 TaxID=3154659 RepID=UPI00332B6940
MRQLPLRQQTVASPQVRDSRDLGAPTDDARSWLSPCRRRQGVEQPVCPARTGCPPPVPSPLAEVAAAARANEHWKRRNLPPPEGTDDTGATHALHTRLAAVLTAGLLASATATTATAQTAPAATPAGTHAPSAAHLTKADKLSIDTPSGVRAGTPAELHISGGTAPYNVVIVANASTGDVLQDLGDTSDTTLTWTPDAGLAGKEVSVTVADSREEEAHSNSFTVGD